MHVPIGGFGSFVNTPQSLAEAAHGGSARGREHIIAIEEPGRLGQQFERIIAERHDVRFAVFRAFGGNDPSPRFKIDFAPPHVGKLAASLRCGQANNSGTNWRNGYSSLRQAFRKRTISSSSRTLSRDTSFVGAFSPPIGDASMIPRSRHQLNSLRTVARIRLA